MSRRPARTTPRARRPRLGHEAQARLAALVASSDDAIIATDLDGVITDWNPAAERIFGYGAREIVGRSILTLLPPDRETEEATILETLRGGGRIEHFETVRVRKDGRRIDVSLSVSPIPDASGRVVAIAKIARDVTEQRQAVVAQARLAALVSSSDDAIVAKDLNGIITDWNPGAERIFGYRAEEAIGRSITMLLPPERLAEEQHILAMLRRGERIDHFDTVRVRKDGRRLDVSISVSPLKDAAGRVVGAAKIAHDVTERKQAEAERERLLASEQAARAEAESASRAKDRFLSMVSHELRTPLASMLGWVGVLRQGRLSPERTAQALNTIEASGRVQARLIEDLLDVSRIATGRLRIELRPIGLRAVVQAAVDAVRPQASSHGRLLSAELDGDAAGAADETRLQRAVGNVLDNALKFTPEGGRIDVSLRRAGDEVLVTVRDTGCGIPRDALSRVFEPFWQAEDVRTRSQRGLGLGLAIVHHLMQHHGGSVAIDSPGEGWGATVVLTLPVLRGVAIPAGHPAAAPRLDGYRVLVVDADADSRQVVRVVLADRGALVSVAASAAEAREELSGGAFDVLVSDLPLADEAAFAAIRELRQSGALRDAPAVGLSGHDDADGARRALAAGFHAYLAKPVDAEALVGTVAALGGPGSTRP